MELISRSDAIAVAMYSKDPVEGIKNLPTVEPAAEVVRCKDCKWWTGQKCKNINGANGPVLNGDWFCCSGEKKDV